MTLLGLASARRLRASLALDVAGTIVDLIHHLLWLLTLNRAAEVSPVGRACHLFQARRADIEGFGRDMETRGRARATIARRLCTIAGVYRYAAEEDLLEYRARLLLVKVLPSGIEPVSDLAGRYRPNVKESVDRRRQYRTSRVAMNFFVSSARPTRGHPVASSHCPTNTAGHLDAETVRGPGGESFAIR